MPSFRSRALQCVREYAANDLINDDDVVYIMDKKEARLFHYKHLFPHYYIDFYHLLLFLMKTNIIYGPREIEDISVIIFKPGKLDQILEHQDNYIAQSANKFVVSQDVAFRKKKAVDSPLTCSKCNKTFSSEAAAAQHKRDKSHVQQVLKKMAEFEDLSGYERKESTIFCQYKPGYGNTPEQVMNETGEFSIKLWITNAGPHLYLLEDIQINNAALKKFVTVEFERFKLIPLAEEAATSSLPVQLRFKFPEFRSYILPLMITYKSEESSHSAILGFNKHLNIEIIPKRFENLQASAPYRRPKPVASDMDETIIPGEKPIFQTNFEAFIKLKSYSLTNEHIQIFNSGLKSEKSNPRANKLLKRVNNLLNVPDPSNCLTVKNYSDMLDLLLFLEEHQMKIDIRHYDTVTHVSARGNRYELEVPDLAENRPSLIVGDSVYLKETGVAGKYEGIVHEKHLDKVILGFDKKFNIIYIPKKKFEISFGYNRTTLKVEHQAVSLVAKFSKYFFPTINDIPKVIQEQFVLKWFNKKLENNVQQQLAVKHIVMGTSGTVPYLIFGPPGTGKTMTVVEAILQVNKYHPGKRILVCTPSNNAANEVARRVITFDGFSRTELLRYVSFSYSINELDKIDGLKKYCNIQDGIIQHPALDSLLKYKIVITTLTTAGRLYNIGVPADHFDYVFVDESGHATESETLIPITSVLINKTSLSGHIVLAGDPKQLGPIVHSPIAKKYGFGTSMLERLMNTNDIYQKKEDGYNNNILTKLLQNYRSHPEIIALSNNEFYDKELIPMGHQFSNLALGHEILPNPKFPMIFHSVLGTDQRESNSPSFFNIQEIKQVCTYVKELLGTKMCGRSINEQDIAIITPYRKQVQKLRQCFKSMPKGNDIMIGSVEQLQGQERLIVIISTVRSKPEFVEHDVKFHLGFLKNPKRFNVAVTRAIALLIVVGNPNLLKYDEYWRLYIERCQLNKAVAGSAFSMDIVDVEAELIASFEHVRIEDDISFGRGNQ